MSGIVGLWNFDGAPLELPLLQRLNAALAHRGPDAKGFWTDGPVGMAAGLLRVTPESLTEVQPVVRAGEAVVVFDGRLDNREEILAAAQDSDGISAASPDSALVLAAYRRHGEQFVERLNGDFALAVFDIRKRQLLLARDYLGVRPLYYARTGGTFLFASEIKAILAYPGFPRAPNEDALAVFLAQGISQDAMGETLFSGVYDCPPAHSLTVTPQKTLCSRYWFFDRVRPQRLKSPGEYAEGFRWHFEQAVSRRIRSAFPVAVSVSGGLDSSSVFCVAETLRRNGKSNAPIVGVSLMYPPASPADESQFLTEIERIYGVTFSRVPIGRVLDGSARSIREGIWYAEIPLLATQWIESQDFYKTVAAQGARVVLTGHWGDQVLADQSHWVDLFNNWRFAELRARLLGFPLWTTDFIDPRYHKQQFWQDLLRYQKRFLPGFVVRSLRRLRARHHLPAVYSDSLRRRAKKAEWQKIPGASGFASFHAQSLCSNLASGYYLSCFEENNKTVSSHGLEIAFPFADRDVLSFVMHVPPEAYSEEAVPKAILRNAMRGVVPDGILDRRWKADFGNSLNESMSSEFAGMVSLLKDSSMILKNGYVNRGLLASELERLKAQIQAKSPTSDAAWKLQRLCRLELWLQVFFGEGKNRAEVAP